MLLAALAAVALASPDSPEDIPKVDVAGFADQLVFLDDGQGNLLAFRKDQPREAVWYGDRERMYALQITGSSANGDTAFDVTAIDFRSPNRRTGLEFRDNAYHMWCADAKRALKPVSSAESKKLAQSVSFHEHRWRRNAVGFYRDEYGVYYLIDRATGDDEDADHRVYIGWQGQVLRAPLKLLASDSLGRVYAAGNGTRRLVITGDRARYVEGDVTRELLPLDLRVDGPFLYTRLGVYGDAPHGTPCDALLQVP